MAVTQKGWNQGFAISYLKKEATYNAAVTPVNGTNFRGLKGHTDLNPDFADKVVNDKDTVSGTEHGTDQQIVGYGFKYTYSTPHVTPDQLAGFCSLSMGSSTPTKDGVNDAYTHLIVEANAGVALASVNAIGRKADKQYLFKGIKGGSWEIKGEEDNPVSFSQELIGSGYRATNADTLPTPLSEGWLMTNPTKIWLESGVDISISAAPTQGSQSISSATPDDISALVKSYSIKYNPNLQEQRMGNDGYAADIDFGRRGYEVSIGMRYSDYIALYEAQTVIALEFDCKTGTKIDTDGALYYGFKARFTQVRLPKLPFPEGGVNDIVTVSMSADVEENGTNKPFDLRVYNAVPAYLA